MLGLCFEMDKKFLLILSSSPLAITNPPSNVIFSTDGKLMSI